MNLKQYQTKLPNIVFRSPNEKELNGHEAKGSGYLIREDMRLADRIKRREAEEEVKLRLDAGYQDREIASCLAVRLQRRMVPSHSRCSMEPSNWSLYLLQICP